MAQQPNAPAGDNPCPKTHCACGRLLRGMMRPCLLLLIAEGAANHGYELHEGLKRLGLDMGDDTARVYRALRKLEEDDLVTSNWDTGGNGPARRNYAITAAGMQYLDDWKEVLQHTRDQLSAIADRLSKLV